MAIHEKKKTAEGTRNWESLQPLPIFFSFLNNPWINMTGKKKINNKNIFPTIPHHNKEQENCIIIIWRFSIFNVWPHIILSDCFQVPTPLHIIYVSYIIFVLFSGCGYCWKCWFSINSNLWWTWRFNPVENYWKNAHETGILHDLCTYSSHVLTNPEFSICYCLVD